MKNDENDEDDENNDKVSILENKALSSSLSPREENKNDLINVNFVKK